jgi:2-polyprenyl-3-methyl-5-hydroxy-6-metoxy-1,4-benzoquinol methylase
MISNEMMQVSCVICGAACTPGPTLYDDRYGYDGHFPMDICSGCGHMSLRADFSSDLLNSLYTDYYPRASLSLQEFQPSRSINGFSAWLNGTKRSAYAWVPENVCILDIGCGFGQTLAYHTARGCDVYGVEIDENIRRVTEKFGFNVHVGLFEPVLYEPFSFDYVTLDQVIEHVIDPVEILQGIAQVLKPGGMAILSTPNANGWGAKLFGRIWINWHAPYHLHHFSVESMRIAAYKAGMQIESFRTLTSSEWLLYQWIHALTFPVMGEPSPFWSPKGAKNTKTKLVLKLLSLLHYTKINHVITRLFDTLGSGDNYLFFLRKI